MAQFDQILLILFWLIAAVSLAVAVRARPHGVHFSLVFSLAVIFYVLPQVVAAFVRGLFSQEALLAYLFVYTASLLSIALISSEKKKNNAVVVVKSPAPGDRLRIITLAYLYIIAGTAFYLMVRQNADAAQEETGGQWTGSITIFFFFSRLYVIGGVLLLFFGTDGKRRLSTIAIPGLVVVAIIYFDRIFIAGRRGEAIEAFFIITIYLYIFHSVRVPRLLTLLSGFVFGLAALSIGEYRSLMASTEFATYSSMLSSISDIDFWNNFTSAFSSNFADIGNSLYVMERLSGWADYDYLFELWNRLVHNYIPGQILGHDVKQALTVTLVSQDVLSTSPLRITGSSLTGFGSAYISFGYLGWVWFAMMAYLMRLYERRMQLGDVFAAVVYVYILRGAVSSAGFTHYSFYTDLIFSLVFIGVPLKIICSGAKRRHSGFAVPAFDKRRSNLAVTSIRRGHVSSRAEAPRGQL